MEKEEYWDFNIFELEAATHKRWAHGSSADREFDSKCKQFTLLKASLLNLFELINLFDGGKGQGEDDIYI